MIYEFVEREVYGFIYLFILFILFYFIHLLNYLIYIFISLQMSLVDAVGSEHYHQCARPGEGVSAAH
jgi:hypothetical protein